MNPVNITIYKKLTKNLPDYNQVLIIGAENVRLMGFKEVVFSVHNLILRRAGISDNRYNTISGGKISIHYDEDLVGDYDLVKLDEDTFQLVKIEKNEK
jgi:hypothetical protein